MSFVVDNSVALAWCFDDEQTEAEMALLSGGKEGVTAVRELESVLA